MICGGIGTIYPRLTFNLNNIEKVRPGIVSNNIRIIRQTCTNRDTTNSVEKIHVAEVDQIDCRHREINHLKTCFGSPTHRSVVSVRDIYEKILRIEIMPCSTITNPESRPRGSEVTLFNGQFPVVVNPLESSLESHASKDFSIASANAGRYCSRLPNHGSDISARLADIDRLERAIGLLQRDFKERPSRGEAAEVNRKRLAVIVSERMDESLG